ncbi:hypothetical protein AAY473_004933 [Plecturocebus cupreus]
MLQMRTQRGHELLGDRAGKGPRAVSPPCTVSTPKSCPQAIAPAGVGKGPQSPLLWAPLELEQPSCAQAGDSPAVPTQDQALRRGLQNSKAPAGSSLIIWTQQKSSRLLPETEQGEQGCR